MTPREKVLSFSPEQKNETEEEAMLSLSRENPLSTGGKRRV
jgi:hypothetical protein